MLYNHPTRVQADGIPYRGMDKNSHVGVLVLNIAYMLWAFLLILEVKIEIQNRSD